MTLAFSSHSRKLSSYSQELPPTFILFQLKSFTWIDPATFAEFLRRGRELFADSFERRGGEGKEKTDPRRKFQRDDLISAELGVQLATRPYARVRASKLKRREKAGFRARGTFRKHLPRSLKLRNWIQTTGWGCVSWFYCPTIRRQSSPVILLLFREFQGGNVASTIVGEFHMFSFRFYDT